jgi:uncharacterized protein (DUF1778 family)
MQTKTVRQVKPRKLTNRKKAASTKSQTVRMDMRINPQAKRMIERAALITGQTLTDFAISNLVQSAMETIERYEKLTLSNRDRDRFLAALDRPAKRLPALAKAKRLHAQATQGE